MHHFHVDKNEGQLVIGYDMIVGRNLMLQLGLLVDFKQQVLQCNDYSVPMKEPIILVGQIYLTSHKMR